MGLRVAVVGVGAFARCFIPLFKAHPLVDELTLCDLNAQKLDAASREFGVKSTSPSLDEVLTRDIDAVALITQHWMHAPQAVQALRAGKHVYSAVPAAVTLDEMRALVAASRESRKVYMMGETSYYYPEALYCRDRFRKGAFGRVVYGEAEYYHDWDHGLYDVYAWRRGKNWRALAGDPPMHYPTHSVGMAVSVTRARATHVSCFGVADSKPEDRDIYRDDNPWKNRFSNESALLKMSDGSVFRINEFRRVGHPGTVRMTLFGTEGSFESNAAGSVWVTKQAAQTERLDEMLRCGSAPVADDGLMTKVTANDGTHLGVSRVHPVQRLPKEFRGLHNGHNGSHQFLVDDFLRASAQNKLPPVNVWQAARYLVPGLTAHESAMRGGELLEVPDFGAEPTDWPLLDPNEDAA
ncbi:MAG: Gfo/Idh/MocA family oxidoreductase [Planctomycetes bacterium]|nr:Gfo/Idh/MocA family oxidoreductase [Planctomycetota bacterium]